MQYALLIYESPRDRERRAAGGDAQAQVDAAYAAFTHKLIAAGAMRGGEVLDLPDFATTVATGPDGRPTVHDGPFADTKEQLGGFFIIEAADLDDALRWAQQCPAARLGKVEIRPTAVPPS